MVAKTLVIFLGLVAVSLAATLLFRNSSAKPGSTSDSAGLIVSKNAIYVAEQTSSRTVSVALARLLKRGFVVIHEDNAGKPGNILGASNALAAGETKNLAPIALSRATKDGETLYAMIHLDDGDGIFNVVKDKPAEDFLNNSPVMMIFTVSSDAREPGAVNL